jgi:hypothetical protein
VFTSLALTWALGIIAPLLSATLPAMALLVPLCANKRKELTMVKNRARTRILAVRLRVTWTSGDQLGLAGEPSRLWRERGKNNRRVQTLGLPNS